MSDDLIARLIEGALDEPDRAAFETAWNDPSSRRHLLAHARLDAVLRAELRAGDSIRRSVIGTIAGGSTGAVKARVVATLFRRRRTPRLVAAACALAAALAVAVLGARLLTSAPDAGVVVTAASGAVLVRGDATSALAVGDRPAAGDRIVADGSVTLGWRDGTRLTLACGALELTSPSRLSVDAGAIRAEVHPRPHDPLVIATPSGEARVIGTSLRLVVDARRTLLDVDHGLVRLADRGGAAIDVAAGSWARADGRRLRHGALADRPVRSTSPGVPRDDPVARRYAAAHPWTADLPWGVVFDARESRADDARGRIELAIDAAAAAGGGVVWLAPGEWVLDGDLALPSGVILRGTRGQGAEPATRLVFPDRSGAAIVNADGAASGLGVVECEIDGGAIRLLPQLAGDDGSLDGWRRATGVVGMGRRKLVVGTLVRHATRPLGDGVSWPDPFSTAIAVYSDADALVADNDLPAATRRAEVRLDLARSRGERFQATVPYPYDNRYGIDVNRLLLGGVAMTQHPTAVAAGALEPRDFPWWFRAGVVIRDNRVAMAGRAGISWSGGGDGATPGSGPQVLDNRVEIAPGTIAYTSDGRTLRSGTGSNENRCFDQAGHGALVAGNRGVVHRQDTVDGVRTGDGEGLLHRAMTTARLAVWRDNDLSGGEGGAIAYQGVSLVADCALIGNRAGAGAAVGGFDVGSVSGNRCADNLPPAVGLDDSPGAP